MIILMGDLRSIISEAIQKREKTKMSKSQSGIRLVRVGGLSPVKQTNKSAPEKRGVWAFIWPYVEPYLLGSTNARGAIHKKDKSTSRYHQMKREGLRHFVHYGVIYTRFEMPGVLEVNGWFRTTAGELNNSMSKIYSQHTKEIRQQHSDDLEARGNKDDSAPVPPKTSMSMYSKDMFEVFVPKPDEGRF